MYSLFQSLGSRAYGHIQFPYFDYLARSYQAEIAKVKAYYRTRPRRVGNTHLLVRLLNSLTVPSYYETESYVSATTARAPYLARALKLTTEISQGELFSGEFYGAGSTEIILSTDEYFDPFEAEKDWTDLTPVQPLLHPRGDLSLVPPYGEATSEGSGLSVIAINLPMLALQYRSYLKTLKLQNPDDPDYLNPAYFVHRYVLPNMLPRHVDLTLFNRYARLYSNQPVGKALIDLPFAIHDYGDRIDTIFRQYLLIAPTKKLFYEQFLDTLPGISVPTLHSALLMPEVAPTRQIHWALMLARLSVMETLILSLGVNSLVQNRSEINALQRTLRQLKRENIYSSQLPEPYRTQTYAQIDRLLSL
jgi:hypothetical protein